jgi:hypothetical protein
MHRVVIVLATVAMLATISYGRVASPCLAGKIKCVGKKANSLLKCQGKTAKKGLDPATDPKTLACLQKARVKFVGCFARIEAKTGATCFTTGDVAAIEAKVDAFVLDVVDTLDGP